MSQTKTKGNLFKGLSIIFGLLSIIAVTYGGFLYFNTLNSGENSAQAALVCPGGSTSNGTQCISNTPSSFNCPSGGYSDGAGTCIRTLCPDGQNPQSGGNCVGGNQMIVYGCGAGDPNTIFRTNRDGFDSSLCTAPGNRGLFSQVGACGSFVVGGSRNAQNAGLGYAYNNLKDNGNEPFYDTYFGFGDSADTLLRDRRADDFYQSMCDDGSGNRQRLCPANQGLIFYTSTNIRHRPGDGDYLCASYSIPSSSLPSFFAGGFSNTYRATAKNNYYPYQYNYAQQVIDCNSFSLYITGGYDNYQQMLVGRHGGDELGFLCSPTVFAPAVNGNYAATPVYGTVVTSGVSNTPEGSFDIINGSVASGWAYDLDSTTTPVTIHFYLDGPTGTGTFIGTTTTDQPRPDVNTAYGLPAAQNYGWNYQIPAQYLNNQSHTLYAYAIDAQGVSNPLLPGSPKTFQIQGATPLTVADIPGLTVTCPTSAVNSTTTCTFTLPSNKTLPADFKLSIGNGAAGGTFTATGSSVSCASVPTGNSVGSISIFGVLGSGTTATKTSTGEKVNITGTSFGNVSWNFSPAQGSTGPLFRSSDNTAITINNFRTIFDPTPSSNTRYTCMMDYHNLIDRSSQAAGVGLTRIPLSANPVPYITGTGTNAGCTFNLTKTQRGNTLNHSLRLRIIDTTITNPSSANPNDYTFYNEYIYRFQGAGVAAGG